MFKKELYWWLVIAMLAGIVLLTLTVAVPARAQCEGPQASSCSTCHAQEDPVNENGEWHIIHANKDICTNCHGGNASTMDKDLAHENLTVQPLNDIYTDCHSCHPDYIERADRFAPTLGITPSSCETPTPVPINNVANEPPSGNINVSTDVMNTTTQLKPPVVIAFFLAILSTFLLGLGWLEKHQTRG